MDVTALLFDMVMRHCPIVNFEGSPHKPEGYDLYSGRGGATHRDAMAALEAAGLAHPEEWAGAVFYRLDHAARAKLTG